VTAPAPAKPRPLLVAAAVLLVVVVCGAGALELLSQVVSGNVERTSTFTPAAGRFVVDTTAGDVTLSPSTDGQVHVHTVVRHGLGRPELIEESTPAGLRLDLDCNDALGSHCEVEYTVLVPPAFEVVIGGTAGDVTASRLTGPLTVDRLAGDVAVFDLTGPLDLRTRTGAIRGDDLRSELVRAASDIGDVQLELLAPPRSVDIDAATGEVDLAVPAGAAYRIDARTDSGDERVLVPADPASPRVLRLDGDTGDLTVRPST
jgi:DUF4097 and DUF4098 domain-containing protein YvlB